MEELMNFQGIHFKSISSLHLFVFLLFVFSFSGKATVMNKVKYLVSFKTNRSACMVRVNNFPMINNFTYKSGSITTGFNITAFVENGLNHIELLMGAVDPGDNSTLYPDSDCELIISKETSTSSQQITSLILSVDKNGDVTPTSSSNYYDVSKEPRVDEKISC